MLAADVHDFGPGELIAPFIVGMSRMAFKPLPGDPVPGGLFVKLSPQIIVFHRLPINRPPVVGSPARQPFGDALAQVLGIGEEDDFALLLERCQGRNGCLELHPVVGGDRFAPGQFADMIPVAKQGGPSARPGISLTATVGMNG